MSHSIKGRDVTKPQCAGDKVKKEQRSANQPGRTAIRYAAVHCRVKRPSQFPPHARQRQAEVSLMSCQAYTEVSLMKSVL